MQNTNKPHFWLDDSAFFRKMTRCFVPNCRNHQIRRNPKRKRIKSSYITFDGNFPSDERPSKRKIKDCRNKSGGRNIGGEVSFHRSLAKKKPSKKFKGGKNTSGGWNIGEEVSFYRFLAEEKPSKKFKDAENTSGGQDIVDEASFHHSLAEEKPNKKFKDIENTSGGHLSVRRK